MRYLVYPLTSAVSLSGQRLQLRQDRCQHLDDDGRRDVGEHTQRRDTHVPESAAAKEVEQWYKRVALEEVPQGGAFDTRHGNVGQQAEDNQHRQHEQDPVPQVRRPERIDHRLDERRSARLLTGALPASHGLRLH